MVEVIHDFLEIFRTRHQFLLSVLGGEIHILVLRVEIIFTFFESVVEFTVPLDDVRPTLRFLGLMVLQNGTEIRRVFRVARAE
ncbi:hypothetical protein C8258_16785 [Nocardia sp. MDA0666]|nr:hypothetical protein C8258_16785 [Nocardia sp. MDA0666]